MNALYVTTVPKGYSSLSKCNHNEQDTAYRLWLCTHNHWTAPSGMRLQPLTSLGSKEMKSRWNWGSITCIICFTCVGSQLSMSSSKASNFSGPLQLYQRGIGHITNSYKRPQAPAWPCLSSGTMGRSH
uniref:Dual endothelin-1/VEGF signal peptide receptor n=1 Tax=Mus musculus TaxID=10090 RepID=DESPR_MOUSE|nr:RecName: Full=Dual endothelin-1/VEGF signal peptide receptor; Short=DEspR protein; Short=Dual endothelin-1/VEGFsp receptor; AltName: Full=FBXW7 antisense RNA 1 homolog [Mus musculus]AAY56470.1 endothelin 1/angiotensin II receptor [Mus musculus]